MLQVKTKQYKYLRMNVSNVKSAIVFLVVLNNLNKKKKIEVNTCCLIHLCMYPLKSLNAAHTCRRIQSKFFVKGNHGLFESLGDCMRSLASKVKWQTIDKRFVITTSDLFYQCYAMLFTVRHCFMICTCVSWQTLCYDMYLRLLTDTVLCYVLASPDRHCIMICTFLSRQTLCYAMYLPLQTDTVLWYVLASTYRHCIMLCTCLSW